MFNLFIVLLSFSESLTREVKVSDQTKCLFLNDEPCMVRSTIIYMNLVELKYYPFMISLNKCIGSCTYLQKFVFQKKKRHNINVINMITNINEAKAITEHISCDFKCKFSVQYVIQNKNGIIKHVNVNVKIIVSAKKIIV